jgi:hypothetical protein
MLPKKLSHFNIKPPHPNTYTLTQVARRWGKDIRDISDASKIQIFEISTTIYL